MAEKKIVSIVLIGGPKRCAKISPPSIFSYDCSFVLLHENTFKTMPMETEQDWKMAPIFHWNPSHIGKHNILVTIYVSGFHPYTLSI